MRDDQRTTNRASGRMSLGYGPQSEPEFEMPFMPGEVLAGKYEVLGLIGVGGLGFVVAANHIELGEKVALKFLRPDAMANAEAVGRFSREARASVQIKSEHVARVFDVGNLPDGIPYIVMEYLEGKDLGVLVTERGALPIRTAVEYVLQICEALAAAHARGVVHRDVKPENLFLQAAHGVDVIKVLDFGISKVALTGSAFEHRQPLVRTTMAMGSPTYMSPEQIRASVDIDARTDIWSLGCVLYELLTGKPAFDAPSLTQITASILEQEPASLRLACPSAPPGLEAVVKQCLAKHPDNRFQNVGELAIALFPYGSPRSRVSVERSCSLLRSAGIAPNLRFDLSSFFPPPSNEAELIPLPSTPVASSTGFVESPVVASRRAAGSGKKWPVMLGAMGLAGLLFVAVSMRKEEPAPPLAAELPAPKATATAAAPAALPPLPAPAPTEPKPAPAAEPEPKAAEDEPKTVVAEDLAEVGSASGNPPARATSKPAAPAPAQAAKRKPAPAPAKPKPAPAPKPAAASSATGEPDIGF
jgi:serine/threonine-protein kinase